MKHDQMFWQARDALQLFAQSWEPAGEVKGVICLVHGLGEHSSRYGHWVEMLDQADYAVLATDLRGHGKSEGARGHTPSFERYMDDLGLLLEEAARRFPEKPCFLYGHSMGGLLVANYVLRRRPRLAGVVITSPGLRTALEKQTGKVAAVRLLGAIAPGLNQPSGLDPATLSRDPAVVEAYRNDPLVHDRISLGMARGSLAAIRYAFAHASEFNLPLLIMHGAADQLVFAEGSSEFAGLVSGECTLKIWDQLYHELHNEPEKDQVFAVLVEWLNGKI
ncbi:MAG: lysophospholipase [Bacillota bacterium]